MKNYLHVFLHNARAAWILSTLEIFVIAFIYAGAKVAGLSDLVSVALSCCVGTLLVIADLAITRSFNIPIFSNLPREKKGEPSLRERQKSLEQVEEKWEDFIEHEDAVKELMELIDLIEHRHAEAREFNERMKKRKEKWKDLLERMPAEEGDFIERMEREFIERMHAEERDFIERIHAEEEDSIGQVPYLEEQVSPEEQERVIQAIKQRSERTRQALKQQTVHPEEQKENDNAKPAFKQRATEQ